MLLVEAAHAPWAVSWVYRCLGRHRREVHFPTGRFGEAIEQAQAVLFLASDESSFVNGMDFTVDGGMTKAYVTPEGPATEAPKNLGR